MTVLWRIILLSLTAIADGQGMDFSVMSYNVENLFDNVHDEGKEDWEYLPLAWKEQSQEAQEFCQGIKSPHFKIACLSKDWNEQILHKKIQNIARVIKSFNQGRAADIIVLQEVENINVLRMLRDWGLPDQGLETLVLLEGPDRRGIDVAIMGRFPLLEEATLHKTSLYHSESNTRKYGRGILQATFNVWGEQVTILANHWPSQRNPDSFRDKTAQTMREIAMQNPNRAIIAMGDFNVLPSDQPNGLDRWVSNPNFAATFEDPLERVSPRPKGTHWYRGRWSHMDHIFIWNHSYSSLRPLWQSLQVISHPWMLKDLKQVGPEGPVLFKGVPKRFTRLGEGYSDHLPVAMQFQLLE